MGEEAKQQLSIRGLENAAGFLQWKVSQRIDTRYTPRLQFVLDKGVKNAMEVSRILNQVLPPEASDAEDDDSDQPGEEPDGLDRSGLAS
jgi:ribosome-binding factor A